MDIEKARAARLQKHDKMRSLLSWLEVSRFKSKQAVADALGLARTDLSGYMHATGRKGNTLLSSDLSRLHSQLVSGLRSAELPLEIPPLLVEPTPVDTSSTTTPTTAPRSIPPAFIAPLQAPKHAVLTVALADVQGTKEGGHVHIMALGQLVERDLRWIVDAPGSGGESKLRLRDKFLRACGAHEGVAEGMQRV